MDGKIHDGEGIKSSGGDRRVAGVGHGGKLTDGHGRGGGGLPDGHGQMDMRHLAIFFPLLRTFNFLEFKLRGVR